ncbi:1113_t:CDS:1, partial [Gigaspora rosea]
RKSSSKAYPNHKMKNPTIIKVANDYYNPNEPLEKSFKDTKQDFEELKVNIEIENNYNRKTEVRAIKPIVINETNTDLVSNMLEEYNSDKELGIDEIIDYYNTSMFVSTETFTAQFESLLDEIADCLNEINKEKVSQVGHCYQDHQLELELEYLNKVLINNDKNLKQKETKLNLETVLENIADTYLKVLKTQSPEPTKTKEPLIDLKDIEDNLSIEKEEALKTHYAEEIQVEMNE